MAVLPIDYTIGTIAIPNNSKIVTGTGTFWATTGQILPGDELLLPQLNPPRFGIIDSIQSNTQLTLVDNFTVAVTAGTPYRIRRQQAGSRYSEPVRQLIEQLASGNVAALGALVGAANKMGYFTGAGAMALTDLTAAARSLLDDPTVAAMLSTLTDNTRLANIAPNNSALGNINYSGFSGVNSSATGLPPNSTFPVVLSIARDPARVGLLAMDAISSVPRAHIRNTTGSGASPWYEVMTQRSMVGTVSQSGGIPTGAMIETGTNANGTYTRFADGTQICFGVTDTQTTNTAWGSYFYNASPCSGTFATAFVGTPSVTATVYRTDGNGVSRIQGGVVSVSSTGFQIRSLGDANTRTVNHYFIATGKWF